MNAKEIFLVGDFRNMFCGHKDTLLVIKEGVFVLQFGPDASILLVKLLKRKERAQGGHAIGLPIIDEPQ